MSGFLAWLHAQLSAIVTTISDVIADKPEPARQVLVYTVAAALVLWLTITVIKKINK